jgi:hypothetical protein
MKHVFSCFFKFLLSATLIQLLSACGSLGTSDNDRTSVNNNPALVPETEYYSQIEKNTQQKIVYDGLVNVLNASATLMTTSAVLAQVDHNARVFQYNTGEYATEKGTAQSNLAQQTEIFLSLFIPEKKFDDLAKKTTRWKIFLDVNGQRYEPKIIKIKRLYAEVASLYPNHTRWSTPYKLIFPVATSISENTPIKLTLTSPLVSTTIEFNQPKAN